MNERKLFWTLTVLSLASAVLLGFFFLSGFLSGGERLDAEMKAYFGESTEFAKDEEDKYIYCAYSLREEPEAVWFQVDKKSPLENNFIEQMMKRDALTFWRTKKREVYFVNRNKEVYTLEEALNQNASVITQQDGTTKNLIANINVNQVRDENNPIFSAYNLKIVEQDLETKEKIEGVKYKIIQKSEKT